MKKSFRHFSAQARIGVLYDKGLGVQRDENEALKWFRKAAEKNEPTAQFNVGFYYLCGRGSLPRNDQEAVRWFEKAAQQNQADAQHFMGYLLVTPPQQQPSSGKMTEGMHWLRKAADQGLAVSQHTLAYLYASLAHNDKQKEKEALQLYVKEAQQNFVPSLVTLDNMYYHGVGGVATDFQMALNWFRKAAEQNNAEGQYGIVSFWTRR
jgi:TPR repeat protein